ncbi:MAG: aminomethyl-transferring glycine dehydrogenase subunit GcvPA [Alphaproteobacteria bacterium]
MRYLPLTDTDRHQMLAAIGVPSVDDLFRDVPEAARFSGNFDLPDHKSEMEVERIVAAMAAKNSPAGGMPSFLGAGAYRHHVPATVDHLIQRGEFLTAYTPYQPEISQGTLQALFEFQTQVALVTGMDVANASMYDGATGCAEAVLMAGRVTRRRKAVLAGGLHPHYRDVTGTQARYIDFAIETAAPDPAGSADLASLVDGDTACLVVQNPDFYGRLHDLQPLAEACHAQGALLVAVVTEIVSLGAVMSPGEMGADIVVAEGQSLGNPLGFGGPYVGLFATRDKFVRQMPGRLAGQTVDADGKRGWVLTLSTREQHIRREKATSNICTNSGLCALAFTIHMSLLGEEGFRRLARLNHANACRMADRFAAVKGVTVLNDAFFNEVTVRLPVAAGPLVDRLARDKVFAGVPASRLYPGVAGMENLLISCARETTTEADIEALGRALEGALR